MYIYYAYVRTVYSAKFYFSEFGITNFICQYYTQPNSRFTEVANVSYCRLLMLAIVDY